MSSESVIVEGRSTCARVGLGMHQTAPGIQPGFEGPIAPHLDGLHPGCYHDIDSSINASGKEGDQWLSASDSAPL